MRLSLLEADVEFNVTKRFLERVKDKAVGQVVQLRAKAGDRYLVGHARAAFRQDLPGRAGRADGAGRHLDPLGQEGPHRHHDGRPAGLGQDHHRRQAGALPREDQKKRPLLVAADIYRPAAIDQLQVLGEQLDMPVFTLPGARPPEICEAALKEAYVKNRDVVIFDTAGRLAIDEPLMQELEEIKERTRCRPTSSSWSTP